MNRKALGRQVLAQASCTELTLHIVSTNTYCGHLNSKVLAVLEQFFCGVDDKAIFILHTVQYSFFMNKIIKKEIKSCNKGAKATIKLELSHLCNLTRIISRNSNCRKSKVIYITDVKTLASAGSWGLVNLVSYLILTRA